MIKDILVLDENGKELGVVSNDLGEQEEALVNLIEVSMDEMPEGKGQVLDVLYIQDMNYGIVIPKHIAKKLSALLDLDLSDEDLESGILPSMDEEYHNLFDKAKELDKLNDDNIEQANVCIQRIDDITKDLRRNK